MTLNLDLIRTKKAIQRSALVPLNEEHEKKLESAQTELSRASFGGSKEEIEQAQGILEETRKWALDNGSMLFIFRSIGRENFRALQHAHPATDDDKVLNPEASWATESFPAALCHASQVDSDLTYDQWVHDVFKSANWGPGELSSIFNVAFEANTSRRVVELGN